MAELIEEILIIWNNYNNMLSIQANDFDKFIELIELMADTIYTINNCADKYGTTYYQQTKKYEEPELNCCSNLINYLESELYWDLENEYDNAFTKSLQII